ncbi:MAG: hypothetical protein EHM67_13765, partial [Hyphomicrobiaceae bacterium]
MTVALVLLLAGCTGLAGSTGTPTGSAVSGSSAGTAAPSTAQTPTQSVGAAPAEEATAAATNTAVTAASQAAPTPEATPNNGVSANATSSPSAAAPGQSSAGSTHTPVATDTPVAAASPSVTSVPTQASAATSAPAAAAAPDLDSLRIALAPVVQGLASPLYVTHAGDGSGRLFVVEKKGAIRIIAEGEVLDAPFLEISDRVGSSASEQGLLGLAFPPDYASRKFFFVNYTDKSGDTVVARYNVTEDPNLADPGSEFVILTFDQPAANHNGGGLVFGPDGYLWIGTGDGGAANDRFGNGQNPETWLAKMLRIDVTSDPAKQYQVPPDNPSMSQEWEVQPEIWAIGLRNPWRYSF